jgi:hypothetical protein
MAEEQDVVVVSINYRLNIFGFPGNPTSEFNLGLFDQRMAIEWVRDNIAGFGGDPNRIVLAGQSAGASSIDMYSYGYVQDPIASGFILQSGTAWSFGLQTPMAAAGLWYNAARAVKCNDGFMSDTEIFSCMLNVPTRVLMAQLPPLGYGVTPGLPYGPVIDGVRVFKNYKGLKAAAKPMLVGNTNDESGLSKAVTPWWSGHPSWYYEVQNIYAFTCPAGQRAAVSVSQANPTWRYRWFGSFPNTLIPWIDFNGAWHGSEVKQYCKGLINLLGLTATTDTLDFQHGTARAYCQYRPRECGRQVHARRLGFVRQRSGQWLEQLRQLVKLRSGRKKAHHACKQR